MQKIENALILAFLKARAEMLRLENEEDGMETVEVVILVAVAVVIAGALINLLTGDKNTGKGGVIDTIFGFITTKIKNLLGV